MWRFGLSKRTARERCGSSEYAEKEGRVGARSSSYRVLCSLDREIVPHTHVRVCLARLIRPGDSNFLHATVRALTQRSAPGSCQRNVTTYLSVAFVAREEGARLLREGCDIVITAVYHDHVFCVVFSTMGLIMCRPVLLSGHQTVFGVLLLCHRRISRGFTGGGRHT